MRIGFLQFAPVRGEVEANVSRLADLLSSERDALVVTPELATSGYLFARKADLAPCALDPGDRVLEPIREVVERNGLTVALGMAEAAGPSVFNSMVVMKPGGTAAVYRKIHLYEREKRLFSPGDDPPPVIEVAGARAGLMICWDWYFPETARFLARQGAQVILHAANLVLPWCMDAMRTRSIENRVFTVTCNRTGSEHIRGVSLSFNGGSQVVSPDGERLVAAGGEGVEGVFLVEIDPADADMKALSPNNRGMDEARLDLLAPQ